MRKLKLLFALLALIVGGSNSAWGQASFNHTYTEGATVAAGGDYFLYNIGAKQFLTSGLNWGTRATVDNSGRVLTLTLSDGKYTIYTQHLSLNERTDGKAGYLTTNGYVDTGTSDANWEFTPVNVEGYTNAYTIKNSDTQYLFFDPTSEGCAVNVGSNTANNNSYWLLIPKTARENAGDYSQYLINTQMNCPWELKTWSGSTANNSDVIAVGGEATNRCGEKYHVVKDIYQNIKATLPNGRYKFFAQAFWRQDGSAAGPVLYANKDANTLAVFNANGEGTAANMAGASASFSAGLYVNSVETFVSDGELKVGINITDGSQWVIFDNFVLNYLGQCVMDYAVALPDGGDMVADTWYYFDIAADADNYTATATTLGDIICTTDGYALTSAVAGNVNLTAENNSLKAQRYYVKSSSANNLVVDVAAYSYSIGEASANANYVQTGNTVTVSYTVSTNNPSAELTQDYSGVTFGGNAIACTPTASGFTFTVPTVTVNTDYTLSIPAGAIKYDADNQNAAQNITLKTPAVFDGTYFFKVENAGALKGQYLSRGKNYGTHATIDKYGLAIKVATDAQNKTTLKPYDTDRYYRMDGNGYDCWADNTDNDDRAKFNLVLYNNHILIHGITSGRADDYFKYNDSDVDETTKVLGDSHGTDGSNGNAIEFSLEDAAAHATAMQTMKDNQAASAAAAAYASGNYASLNGITTVAALEAELTANYIQGDFVSPSAIESVLEKYQGTQPNSANTVETVYSNTINITEPGFYKFSMQAFYRAGDNNRTQAMHEAGIDFNPVVLFFGDAQTQIKSVYDESSATALSDDWGNLEYKGAYYPNNMVASLKAFQNDEYHNDVWFYAAAAGTYTYGVKYLGFANANAQWFIYSPESVTITSYAAAADATDYENLAKAISEAEGKVIGFEEGEYAPYNNVDAVAFIATAKAIDTEATNSKLLIQSAITALSEWTVNEEELNAFYDGDFSECAEDNASPLDYTPAGWTASDNMRMMLKNTETYPGLVDASAKSAMMSWGGGITYGETTGYTMPLKANTIYKLTFKAAGWNDETRSGITVSVLNTEDGMAAQNLGTPDRDIKAAQTWNTAGMTSYEVLFVTGAAGNYVFHVQSGNNMVLTDFEIKKAASQVLEFADGLVPTYAPGTYPTVKISRTLTENKWATAIYPFALSHKDVEIVVLNDYLMDNDEVYFEPANNSVVNKPFLMKSSATMNEIELNNVAVAKAEAIVDDKDELSFIGVYKETEVGRGENVKNFVLKDNTIYRVGDYAATINPYRAYFQINQPGEEARLKFFINGQQTTDIEGVKAEKNLNGVIYNLNGQRVEKANKGLYISNGKKVVLK